MQQTAHLPIGIAIMNAGFGTSGNFLTADLDTEINMLHLNCRTVLMLTQAFAIRMARQERGAIVLMSSIVGLQGVPNAAHYAATKAYVHSLGEALAVELKSKGIDILIAAPGPVQSGFAQRAIMQLGKALTTRAIGVPILKSIGRRKLALPGFLTKFLVFNLRLVPRWAKVKIMGLVMAGFTKHHRS